MNLLACKSFQSLVADWQAQVFGMNKAMSQWQEQNFQSINVPFLNKSTVTDRLSQECAYSAMDVSRELSTFSFWRFQCFLAGSSEINVSQPVIILTMSSWEYNCAYMFYMCTDVDIHKHTMFYQHSVRLVSKKAVPDYTSFQQFVGECSFNVPFSKFNSTIKIQELKNSFN